MDEISGAILKFFARILLEIFLEILFRVVFYVTGFVFLFLISIGSLPIAAKSPYWRKGRRSSLSFGLWANLSDGRRILHPDLVSLTGFLVWAVTILGVWLKLR